MKGVEDSQVTKLDRIMEIIQKPPDNYAVQSCCLAYGGNSFPGPMRDALMCHLSILIFEISKVIESEATSE